MKYLAGLFACLLITTQLGAQEIDEARMNRDIKIAEDIISGLLSQEGSASRFFGNTKVSGNYINDYGVIFNIPTKSGLWPMGIKIDRDDDGDFIIMDKNTGQNYAMGSGEFDLSDMADAKDDYIQSTMETFLVDYADLIGQLKASDKIMLKSENKSGGIFVVSGKKYSFNFGGGREEISEACCGDDPSSYVLTAEVLKENLTQYKAGSIDRDELIDLIMVEKTESVSEKEPELELLSTIFRRLYRSDLSTTYFATREPDYDRITKFGVIYDWRIYSSNTEGNKHNMPTIDVYDLTSEERNRKVEEIYPKFKEEFARHLVEYGRTLRGLEDHELLMFKIKMTECKGCSIPKSIEVSVKKSVLDAYEKQDLTLEAAAKQVSISENMTD
jgi:hypothetical protein